jgi:hypothetical protein
LDKYKAYYAPKKYCLYLIEKDGWTSESLKRLLNILGKHEKNIATIIIYNYSFSFTNLTEIKNNLKASIEDKIELIERF